MELPDGRRLRPLRLAVDALRNGQRGDQHLRQHRRFRSFDDDAADSRSRRGQCGDHLRRTGLRRLRRARLGIGRQRLSVGWLRRRFVPQRVGQRSDSGNQLTAGQPHGPRHRQAVEGGHADHRLQHRTDGDPDASGYRLHDLRERLRTRPGCRSLP